jgi:hypothetical protein
LDSGNTTLDLTALARAVLGDTLTTAFIAVRHLLIVNDSADREASLIVGAAGTNEWSAPFGADGDTVKIPAGGYLMLGSPNDGFNVDDSNKNLKLASSGGDVTYSIAILGVRTYTGGDSSGSGA